MVSLEILLRSNNSLKAPPEGLGGLQGLRVLDCGCNDITTLPTSVGMLEALKVLDMRINEIAGVPGELGKCRHAPRPLRLRRLPAPPTAPLRHLRCARQAR